MVDGASNDKGSTVAIQLGRLHNGAHWQTVWQNTNGTILGLVAGGERGASSSRVGDETVTRVRARVANGLRINSQQAVTLLP